MAAHYDLGGRVALVTGASAGLGEQFARGLAASGADVVLAARRGEELERIARDINDQHGVRALPVVTDVGREEDIIDAVGAATRRFGRLDILVNNAGCLVAKPLIEQTLEDWQLVMNVNLTSAFVASREAAKVMIPRGSGAIINISSAFAFGAAREFPEVGYYAAKGGMIMLTKATAVELGEHGIRVNAVAPGFFPTDIGAGIPKHVRDTLVNVRRALDHPAENEWIRGAVCFLASDEARYVTGTTLTVDGGWGAF
jgi:NAD(P)-dependent dehydrogenase (short-subunit alcohol dehydrogenase family)